MLDTDTKRRIDTCRDILVGKVPDPKSQVEQITIALIYKFMDNMDAEAEYLGGKRSFFANEYGKYGWAGLMAPNMGGFDVLALYSVAIQKMNENQGIPALFRDIFKKARRDCAQIPQATFSPLRRTSRTYCEESSRKDDSLRGGGSPAA